MGASIDADMGAFIDADMNANVDMDAGSPVFACDCGCSCSHDGGDAGEDHGHAIVAYYAWIESEDGESHSSAGVEITDLGEVRVSQRSPGAADRYEWVTPLDSSALADLRAQIDLVVAATSTTTPAPAWAPGTTTGFLDVAADEVLGEFGIGARVREIAVSPNPWNPNLGDPVSVTVTDAAAAGEAIQNLVESYVELHLPRS